MNRNPNLRIHYQGHQLVTSNDTGLALYSEPFPGWNDRNKCLVCASFIGKIKFECMDSAIGHDYERSATLFHCDTCGWWCVSNSVNDLPRSSESWPHLMHSVHWPILTHFDLGSSDLPVKLLRDYLIKHYSDVREISAQKAEDLVRSVYREIYGDIEVQYFNGSVYRADGGVDLVVIDTKRDRIGIQVKRRISRTTEPISEVRAFVTALILNGLNRGVYVALSSSFSDEAKKIAKNIHLESYGLRLDLVNSERFYSFLARTAVSSDSPIWYDLLETTEGCNDPDYFDRVI